MNVLIIEDERALAEEIASFLRKENFLCEIALTGLDASEKISINLYDFILLDLGLPDYNGFELLKETRNIGNESGIIVITARGEVEDKVKGLNLGADDYLAKPFALIELLSRIQAVARRKFQVNEQILTLGDFKLVIQARKILFGDQEVEITRKEYELLQYLAFNRDKVLTRHQLYEHIWGNVLDDRYDSNFIDVHVKNIRKKLNLYASATWLETVRGIGYRITTD
jgi:DNA-binding response OmpR family regulator